MPEGDVASHGLDGARVQPPQVVEPLAAVAQDLLHPERSQLDTERHPDVVEVVRRDSARSRRSRTTPATPMVSNEARKPPTLATPLADRLDGGERAG